MLDGERQHAIALSTIVNSVRCTYHNSVVAAALLCTRSALLLGALLGSLFLRTSLSVHLLRSLRAASHSLAPFYSLRPLSHPLPPRRLPAASLLPSKAPFRPYRIPLFSRLQQPLAVRLFDVCSSHVPLIRSSGIELLRT